MGQKTPLDVLDPVQKVLAAGGDDLVARVRQCAFDSAAATAHMDAIKGRALSSASARPRRPGSRSMVLIIGAVRPLEPRRGRTMKKLINDVETVLAEGLDGFSAAHADICCSAPSASSCAAADTKPGRWR